MTSTVKISSYLKEKGLSLLSHATDNFLYQNIHVKNLAENLACLQPNANIFIKYIRKCMVEKEENCSFHSQSFEEECSIIEIANLLDEAGLLLDGVYDADKHLLTARFNFQSPLAISFLNGSFLEIAVYHLVKKIIDEISESKNELDYEVITNAVVSFPFGEKHEYDLLLYDGHNNKIEMIEVKSGTCYGDSLRSKLNEIDFDKQIVVCNADSNIPLKDIFSTNTVLCKYNELQKTLKKILLEKDQKTEPENLCVNNFPLISNYTNGEIYTCKPQGKKENFFPDDPTIFHLCDNEAIIPDYHKADLKSYIYQNIQNGYINNFDKNILGFCYIFGQLYIIPAFIQDAVKLIYGFTDKEAYQKVRDSIIKLNRHNLLNITYFDNNGILSKTKLITITKIGFFIAREFVTDESYFFNFAERIVTSPRKIKKELACVQCLMSFLQNTNVQKFTIRHIYRKGNLRIRPMAELLINNEKLYVESIRKNNTMVKDLSGKLTRYQKILAQSDEELSILVVCENEAHALETYHYLLENECPILHALIFTDDWNLVHNFENGFYFFHGDKKTPAYLIT